MNTKPKDQIDLLFEENQALLKILFPEYYEDDVEVEENVVEGLAQVE